MTGRQKCPTCKTDLDPGAYRKWFPFCSERCQLIDLGAWMDERHRIPGNAADDPDYPPEDGSGTRH